MASATVIVPHEAVEIDIDALETSSSRLISIVRPQWAKKKLTFKNLSIDDGLIIRAIFPSASEDELHGIVVKIYQKNSDIYIDHQLQLKTINHLAQHGMAPRLLLTFTNGYFANYVPGKILNTNEQRTHQLIARKLAEFHSTPVNTIGHQLGGRLAHLIGLFTGENPALNNQLDIIAEHIKSVPEKSSNFFTSIKSAIGLNTDPTPSPTLKQLESLVGDISWRDLASEIDRIRVTFEKNWEPLSIPVVVCLNDLQVRNFLYNEKNSSMVIVEFDHCSPNYYLIDIVSYFLELAKENYETNYPERRIQKAFFADYLKYSSLNVSNTVYDHLKPTDLELERLCDLCGRLIAPVHLYWALWAFLQALLLNPAPTFDYITYGKIRLEQYHRHKNNFFLPIKA